MLASSLSNMSIQPYSIRELDSKFEQVCNLITEKCADIVRTQESQGKVMVEVKEQTIKTNGRVTGLEIRESERRGSSKVLIAIWSIVLTMAVSYLVYLNSRLEAVRSENATLRAEVPGMITSAVSQAILPYAK